MIDHSSCTLQIAGLHERIEQLEHELAASRAETAAVRTELCEFAAAVARERHALSVGHDEVDTAAETPHALAAWREQTTKPIPRETMRQMVDGGLR